MPLCRFLIKAALSSSLSLSIFIKGIAIYLDTSECLLQGSSATDVFIWISWLKAMGIPPLPLLVSTEQIEIKVEVSSLQDYIRKILKAILSQSECFLCSFETEPTSLWETKRQLTQAELMLWAGWWLHSGSWACSPEISKLAMCWYTSWQHVEDFLKKINTCISKCQVLIQPQTSPKTLILSSPVMSSGPSANTEGSNTSMATFLILSPEIYLHTHLVNKHLLKSYIVPCTVMEVGA